MATDSRADLITRSQTVKNETSAGANTANRIGSLFEDLTESAYPTISASVPANGALEQGRFIIVENVTVGRELYVGNSSNNPVPACGYRECVIDVTLFGASPTFTIEKNTLDATITVIQDGTNTFHYINASAAVFTDKKTFCFVGSESELINVGSAIIGSKFIPSYTSTTQIALRFFTYNFTSGGTVFGGYAQEFPTSTSRKFIVRVYA